MSTLRYQSIKTLTNGFSIVLQSYPFIQKITLKVGQALPDQGKNPDKYYLSGIYNENDDYDTSYITIRNSKFEYKIPYKGNFEFVLDKIKEYDQGYDAHKHLNRKIELIKSF